MPQTVPDSLCRRRPTLPGPDSLEVGFTWLARAAQRTPINTEAKWLLLSHAFEPLEVERVLIKTDARNLRSRAAIERIGASFEGILRRHLPAADGGVRDTAMFSSIAPEWPSLAPKVEFRRASPPFDGVIAATVCAQPAGLISRDRSPRSGQRTYAKPGCDACSCQARKPTISRSSRQVRVVGGNLAQMVLLGQGMPRRSHRNAASRRSSFFVETAATATIADEQSGVRALPRASLPPPHPVALLATAIRVVPSLGDSARASIVPELRLAYSEHQASFEASQRVLLERAQRTARIKQAAAEASVRLALLFREQEERYLEEMVWRAKLREAKQRIEEEAERKLALAAAAFLRADALHPPPGPLHHSERGSVYASGNYRDALTKQAMVDARSRNLRDAGTGDSHDR